MSRKFRITGDTAKLSHHFSIGEVVELVDSEDGSDVYLFKNEEGIAYYVALADVEEIF